MRLQAGGTVQAVVIRLYGRACITAPILRPRTSQRAAAGQVTQPAPSRTRGQPTQSCRLSGALSFVPLLCLLGSAATLKARPLLDRLASLHEQLRAGVSAGWVVGHHHEGKGHNMSSWTTPLVLRARRVQTTTTNLAHFLGLLLVNPGLYVRLALVDPLLLYLLDLTHPALPVTPNRNIKPPRRNTRSNNVGEGVGKKGREGWLVSRQNSRTTGVEIRPPAPASWGQG